MFKKTSNKSENLPAISEFHKLHYEITTIEKLKGPWLLSKMGLKTIFFTFFFFSIIVFSALGVYIYYIS